MAIANQTFFNSMDGQSMLRIMFCMGLVIQAFAMERGWIQSMIPTAYHSICKDSSSQIWLASDVGIYSEKNGLGKWFTTKNGLESNEQASLLCLGDTIYSFSKFGHIAEYKNGQFQRIHNSYVRNNWLVNDQSVISFGNYFLIPFDQGLAFYNRSKKISDLTLENVGGFKIAQHPIRKLFYKNDFIYVVLDSVVLRTRIDAQDLFKTKDSLGKLMNILEPGVWQNFGAIHGGAPYMNTWFVGDSLYSGSGKGFRIDSLNFFDQKLILNGREKLINLMDSSWLSAGSLDQSKILLIEQDKRIWECKDTCHIRTLSDVSQVNFFDLFIDEQGNPIIGEGLIGAGVSEFQFDRVLGRWAKKFDFGKPIVTNESRVRNNLTVGLWSNSGIIRGSWGSGLWIVNYSKSTIHNYNATNSCLEDVFGDGAVFVAGIQSDVNGYYFNYLLKNGGYGLAYVDFNEKIQCLAKGTGVYGRNIFLARDSLIVGTDAGIDFFVKKDGAFAIQNSFLTKNGAVLSQVKTPDGSLWAITNTQVLMNCSSRAPQDLCQGMTPDSLVEMNQFFGVSGVNWSALSVDAAGDLWLGTAESGIFRLKNAKQLSASDLVHFTEKDGLGSNKIVQMKSSPWGEMWFLHPHGLSRWSNDAIDSSLRVDQELRPYPNPFRFGKHSLVKIANIPAGSSMTLIDARGEILYQKSEEEIFGGIVEIPIIRDLPDLAAGSYRIVIHTPSKTLQRTLAIVR